MWKRISSLLLITLTLCFPAYAQTAEITSSGDHPYKSVRLTPEVYRGANEDLSDLRVRDSQGNDVPYFIHSGGQKTSEQSESYPMILLNSYTQEDAFYLDYKLDVHLDGDVIATSLVMETQSTNFAKDIALFGSYDNQHWELVQEDILYHVGGKIKTEILLISPQKYTHYRLKLNNNLEKISFDSVMLKYDRKETQEYYFRETLQPQFTTEEEGQDTLLHIEGLTKLKLYEVTIETDSMFKRMVSDPFGGSKELYNLSFEHISYKDMTVPLGCKYSGEDDFTLRINNHDDVPIHITNVTVSYETEEIVFAAGEESSFSLYFGEPSAVSPVYDIVSYKEEILQGSVDQLLLGEVTQAEPVEPTPVKGPDYALILNIVIFLIAVFLGVLILLLLRRKDK